MKSQAGEHTLPRDSLATTELLPGYLLDILATGEISGNLGAGLGRFVTILEDETFTIASQQFMMFVALGEILRTVAIFTAMMH